MILRRYGDSMQSVEPSFDSKALTEIGFRRDRELSVAMEEFERGWSQVETRELAAKAEGSVQDEVEARMLRDLEAQLREMEGGLAEGEVLVVLSEQGVDHPKTHTDQKTVVEQGENRLYFYIEVDPPLRVGRYRKSV